MNQKEEISKKEYLLLQVESMAVNKKAIILATRRYATCEIVTYEDAIEFIKKQDGDTYRIKSILNDYQNYEHMAPQMIDKWIQHYDGLCSEPIDRGDGLPIESSIGGINVTVNGTEFSIHETGVYILQDNDVSTFISKAELQYLVRAVDNIGELLRKFK